MSRAVLAPLALALAVASAGIARADDEPMPYDLAISRLRACATSGMGEAPRDSLRAAVISVRALCGVHINRVYAASDRKVAAENPGVEGDALAWLRKKARRAIDFDLAALVSHHTGLQH